MKFLMLTVLCFVLIQVNAKENPTVATVTQITNPSIGNGKIAPTASVTVKSGLTVFTPSDALNKRNVQIVDLTNAKRSPASPHSTPFSSASPSAKSYDPPPEFYRGPGSSGSTLSAPSPKDSTNGDSATAGFISKPITFPDINESNKRSHDIASEYNSWQLLRGGAAEGPRPGPGPGPAAADRISVGHYGSPDHGASHGGGFSSLSPGYAYERSPYGVAVEGGYYNDFVTGAPPQYQQHHPHGQHIHHPYGVGNVLAAGHDGYSNHHGNSGEAGIIFDVYGSKDPYAGVGGGAGGGSGHGGEYHESYHDGHEHVAHKTQGYNVDWQHKALLAKSFLIPLASAAVLGIAAALINNPLLLQLGTVSGVTPAIIGKRRRKRRDLSAMEDKDKGFTGQTTRKGHNHKLAYRGHYHQRDGRQA